MFTKSIGRRLLGLLFVFKKNHRRCNKRSLTFVLIFLVGYMLAVERFMSRATAGDETNNYYTGIDLKINTSHYLSEYIKYDAVKVNLKRQLDQVNAQSKVVLPRGRSEQSLFKKEYLLLEYTTVFQQRKYCDLPIERSPSYINECPYKNCHFTCDRSLARSADLLLFHVPDLIGESTETKIYIKKFLAHLETRRDQIWLLWHDEVTAF
jgi:hypothetical protein